MHACPSARGKKKEKKTGKSQIGAAAHPSGLGRRRGWLALGLLQRASQNNKSFGPPACFDRFVSSFYKKKLSLSFFSFFLSISNEPILRPPSGPAHSSAPPPSPQAAQVFLETHPQPPPQAHPRAPVKPVQPIQPADQSTPQAFRLSHLARSLLLLIFTSLHIASIAVRNARP